ncbi:MAG TPA: class II aldolase/adducin family protein [Rhizobiaceae bacterium]|nr:class II aldolase/adducin family protein [Rhizobiaceae bacterium]
MPDLAREFAKLRALSARVGADPLLVQAAGGNTSVKDDGVLWIKASGTWLMQAETGSIFVPVAMAPLMDALAGGGSAAEKAQDFVIAERNPGGLRPSIETTMHSVLPQRIVVHVHCVNTIALAVRRDAETLLAQRLEGLNWAFVPYARPGLPLTRAIEARLRPGVDVLVLGNHGLVVAAESVEAAEPLLVDVCARLDAPARIAPPADVVALERRIGGAGYVIGAGDAQGVATDLASLGLARQGSLYPDHVIFLGAGLVVAGKSETAADIEARHRDAGLPPPAMIACPGEGVLMRGDASASAHAMARCLADVAARIPPGAAVNTLNEVQDAELLNWDAEKYRQALEAGRARGGP